MRQSPWGGERRGNEAQVEQFTCGKEGHVFFLQQEGRKENCSIEGILFRGWEEESRQYSSLGTSPFEYSRSFRNMGLESPLGEYAEMNWLHSVSGF